MPEQKGLQGKAREEAVVSEARESAERLAKAEQVLHQVSQTPAAHTLARWYIEDVSAALERERGLERKRAALDSMLVEVVSKLRWRACGVESRSNREWLITVADGIEVNLGALSTTGEAGEGDER